MILSKKHALNLLVVNNSLFNFSRTLPGAILVIILFSHNISIQTFTFAKALQLLTSALLTIPAGIFADRFGRKKAVIVACIAQIIYFICLVKPTNTSIVIGEIFNGIGLCFYIGSFEGWLLKLNRKDCEIEFKNNILKSSEFVYLSIMIASIIGAIFSSYVIIITLVFLVITTLIFVFTFEPKIENNKNVIFLKDSSHFLFKSNNGLIILLTGSLSIGLMQFIFQFWQPFFKNIGVKNDFYFGIIFAFTMFSQYLSSILLRKHLYPKFDLMTNLCLCWLSSFISMCFIFFISDFNKIILIVFMYALFNAFMANANSLFSVFVAKSIKEEYHSTGISIIDFFGKLLGSIFFFLVIPFIKTEYIKYSWIILSLIFLILSTLIFLLYKNKFLQIKNENLSNEF